MPAFVTAAVLAGVASGIGTAIASGAAFSFGWAAFGTSLVLGGLSKALERKPKSADASAFQAQGRTITVRQPTASYQIIVGETRCGGDITFIDTSEDNLTLWIVVTLAGHVCQGIYNIYFNDELVTLNGDGDGTGKWAGHVFIRKATGAEVGQPFPELVTDSGGRWSETDEQAGKAKIAIKLVHDAELFASGIPNITAVVKGALVLDPRSSATVWTQNPALLINAYLTNATFGLGAQYPGHIAVDDLVASANLCEERVRFTDYANFCDADADNDWIALSAGARRMLTGDGVRFTLEGGTGSLPGGISADTTYYAITAQGDVLRLATSYGNALAGVYLDITSAGSGQLVAVYWDEPRYTANGAFRVNQRPRDILLDLLPSMAGKAVNVGGKWHILAGMFETPTVTLDEGDLAGPIQVQALVSRAENCNGVKGIYVDPSAAWQPSEFPPIASETYKAEDNGERIWRDIDLTAFTQSSSMAQRLSKIELLRTRQALTVVMPCKLSGFRAQTGRTVYVNNARFGWAPKAFEVVNSRFTCANNVLGVELSLRETAEEIYDWTTDEEQVGDFAPNARFPRIIAVDPNPRHVPQNLRIREWGIPQPDGTYTNRIEVEADPVTSLPVDHYELETAFPVDPDVESYDGLTFTPFGTSPNPLFVAAALSDETGLLVVRMRAVGDSVAGGWAVAAKTLLGPNAFASEIGLPSPDSALAYASWKSQTQTAQILLRLHFPEYSGEPPDGVLLCYSVWDRANAVTVLEDNDDELKVINAEDVLMASFAGDWPVGGPLVSLAGTTASRLVLWSPPLTDEQLATFEPGQWYAAVGTPQSDWRKVASFDPAGVTLNQPFDSSPGTGAVIHWAQLDWNDARRYEFRLGIAESGGTYEVVRWNELENRGGTDFYLTNVTRGLEGTTQIALDGLQLAYLPAPGAGTMTLDFPLSLFRPVDGSSGDYEATLDAEITVPSGAFVSLSAVLYKRLSFGGYVRSAIVPTTYAGSI